jgi:hypothetical protein
MKRVQAKVKGNNGNIIMIRIIEETRERTRTLLLLLHSL